jgi:glycosyltransferase involved in cell wall biosynthesis
MSKLLTVGMSTYDDYDGVYFSIQALRMYHPIMTSNDVEILIIDNNPDGSHSESIKHFINHVPNGKYIPFKLKTSTAVRNEIFKNASGKYSVSMDCHVLFPCGSLESLLKYFEQNENCKNIVQGPLLYDDLKSHSTHFSPTWSSSMYGQWATDYESLDKGEPFEIPMQGLGVFACETKNWVGFNKFFKGFGGEEGYIHEKFRRFGGKAICLPQFKWVHRFARPNGVKYPLVLEDRIWNYFVGWLEITQDPNHEMIVGAYEHFKNKIPPGSIDNILEQAKQKILL